MMKKSEILVSMPMTTYDELELYKNKFENITNELKSCIDTQPYDSGVSTMLNFDVSKALEICKKTLSIKYSNIDIDVKF